MIPIVGVALFVGCSPGAKERLKHFFFEVPEKPAAAEAEAEKKTPAEELPEAADLEQQYASIHPPYAQHDCKACHNPDSQMQVREDLSSWCGACHPRYFSDEVEHPPVAAGDCLMCHRPHRSEYKFLLANKVESLCADCHGGPEDLSQDAHSGPDAADCTKCHEVHFGSGPMLRPGISVPKEKEE